MALIRQFSKAPAKVIPMDAGTTAPLYTAPRTTIAELEATEWQGPGQPTAPVAPAGTEPRGLQYSPGANFITSPRPTEKFTFDDLRSFATYPLVRFIISSLTDQLCDQEWQIRVKPMPGETNKQRLQREANDDASSMLTSLFQFPNPDCTWRDFLKMWLEDVFVIDAPALLLRRNKKGDVAQIRAIDGALIVRRIDENGWTPQDGDPAYGQVWFGEVATNLTTDQLVYRPRNVRTHKLYGHSPVEQALKLIIIGQKRLDLFDNFYTDGSIPDGIQVVPSGVSPAQIREQQEWMSSSLAGNLAKRVQLRLLQGFETGNRPDQFIFPKEKALTDETDDFLIRVLCYAFGVSPQRLMKMNNRSTANASQDASEEEGREPIKSYVADTINLIIQKKMGYKNHEFAWQDHRETDVLKQAQADEIYVKCGVNTINEIRENKGDDPSENPVANELVVITPTGGVVLGQAPPVPPGQGGDGPANSGNSGNSEKPAKQPNAMGDGKGGHDTSKAAISELTENMAELRRMVGSVHERLLEKYSDDQARDDHGRWTSEGGGPLAGKSDGELATMDPEIADGSYSMSAEPTPSTEAVGPGGMAAFLAQPKPSETESTIFASPNQEENLSFEQAHANLVSPAQARLNELAYKAISHDGGVVTNAIGDWKDGAENSLVMVTNTTNIEDVKYQAAIVGRAGNQKGVITFSPVKGGPDAMHTMTVPGTMSSVRSGLSKVGIDSRTLEQHGGQIRVYVFDQGGKMAGTMEAANNHFGNVGVETTRGHGEYIGGNTREEGRAAFDGIIGKYEREHPERAVKSVQRAVLHGRDGEVRREVDHDRGRSARKVKCSLCEAEVPRLDGEHITAFGEVLKCHQPVVKKKSRILSY